MTNEPVMREVLTKAVCGKGQLLQQNVVEIPVNTASDIQVLGNHLTNARLKSALPVSSSTNNKMVKVEGQYDLHVWYATGQDTHSVKKTINYVETIPLNSFGEDDYTNAQAYAEITSQPLCKKVFVSGEGSTKKIKLEIEQGLSAEVLGVTKLFVKSVPTAPEEVEAVVGLELIPPQAPIGLLTPEFYPDQMDDLCDDDFEK